MKFAFDDGVDGVSSVRYIGIAVRDVDGTFKSARGHDGGLVTMSWPEAVSHGLITGATPFSTNGDYTAGGAVTDIPVNTAGAVNISLTGAQMSFVSTSVNDTAAGTGMRQLQMSYIEHGTLRSVTETITLNGTTPVLSVATNIRFINSLTGVSYGSGGKNAGVITATNGGLTYGHIATGYRVQKSAYRMIPTGKIFFPDEIVASSNSSGAAAAAVFTIVGWSPSVPFWTPTNSIGCQDGPLSITLQSGRGIVAGNVIGIEVTVDKATRVTASVLGRLENA